MTRAVCLLLFCTALACSRTVEVFDPIAAASSRSGDAGAGDLGDAANEPDPDLTMYNPRNPDAAASPTATGEPGQSPCGACEGTALCAGESCVDAAGVTVLDAWMRHTCLIGDGRLFCWGDNGSGQLGLGDNTVRDRPERVGSWNDWLDVAGGEAHTCGIRAPGTLYCWGHGSEGQLAQGDVTPRLSPARVGERSDWASLSCGGNNCCALDRAGRLFCWGENLEGKVGLADAYGEPDVLEPRQVAGGGAFRDVSVGQGHVCAIRESGELLCWGRNTLGELGLADDRIQVRELSTVGSFRDFVDVEASQHHSCAVRDNGELYCWGANEFFELGSGAAAEGATEPRRVGGDSDWAKAAVGWFHSCALKRDGSAYCWGRSIEGQIGQGGNVDPEPAPLRVASDVRLLTTGHMHTCALSGAVFCWGANDRGQLATGDDARRYEPTQTLYAVGAEP